MSKEQNVLIGKTITSMKITTDRGHIIVDYRNESNGYYGGSLSWPDDHFYGGVYGQNDSSIAWQEVQP